MLLLKLGVNIYAIVSFPLVDEELGWPIKLELGVNVSSRAHAHHKVVYDAIFFHTVLPSSVIGYYQHVHVGALGYIYTDNLRGFL